MFILFKEDSNSTKEEKLLNIMLERSFYIRLQTINNRWFNIDDSNKSVPINRTVVKVNEQEIGQCFIKRVDETRVILTVAPSLVKKHICSFKENTCNLKEASSEEDLQPLNRSRANTWHYTKRSIEQTLSEEPQENSTLNYRTRSLEYKPYYSNTTDLSWAQLKFNWEDCIYETKDEQNDDFCDADCDLQDCPTSLSIGVYDCRRYNVENALMFKNIDVDNLVTNNLQVDYNSDWSLKKESDEELGEETHFSSQKNIIFDQSGKNILFKF